MILAGSDKGRPRRRFRWTPTPRSGLSRAKATASAKPGMLAMIVALDSAPFAVGPDDTLVDAGAEAEIVGVNDDPSHGPGRPQGTFFP